MSLPACLSNRSIRFASAAIALCVLVALSPRAIGQQQTTTVSFSPSDTFLNLDTSNYSSERTLSVYTWPDNMVANAILMKFNLSSLPANAVVTKAQLEMTLTGSDSNSSNYRIAAHKIVGKNPRIGFATGYTIDGTSPWTAGGNTYNGIPLAQSDIAPAEFTATINRSNGIKAWDITQMTRQWVADPSTNFGVLLNGDATVPKDRYRVFASNENNTKARRPLLKITYTTADTQPPSVTISAPKSGAELSQSATLSASASDNAGVAGVTFRLNGQPITGELASPYSTSWNTATVADGSYTLTAQARDVAGNTAVSTGVAVTVRNGYLILEPEDTSLHLNTTSQSQDPLNRTYTWPDAQPANAVLLKFNLTSIPQNAVVEGAELHLALVESDAVNAGYRVGAHKVVNRNPQVALATGYTANGSQAWTPSSVRFDGIPLAQSDIQPAESQPSVDRTAGYKTWPITNMVRDWVADPGSNYGVLLNPDTTVARDRYRYFASMEHENASLRPYLRVKLAGGTSSSSPTPPAGGGADTVGPSVALTAPASGATVSGTTALTVNTSDNVGVVGVRYWAGSVSIADVTTAPFSATWDTKGVPNGTHTLTAVARDAAGNKTTSAGVTVSVSNSTTSTPPPSSSGGTLASKYPGDVGIEADPSVVFVERFDQSSLSTLLGNWTDVRNSSVMSLTTDVPPGSPGGRSLNIPSTSGGGGGHLYRTLSPGINDTVYVRYYIKYPSSNSYNHSGVWVGGANPLQSWPAPAAGTKPSGNDRFVASAEQNTVKNKFDHYNYWMNMRQSGDGNYWGNELLNNPNLSAPGNQWMCVEHMVKLNNPVSDSNGEHAIWVDDVKVSHLGKGFPNGRWQGGVFTQDPTGSPFEGFRWRSDANLNINWVWLQNYTASASSTSNMLFDHLVVATSRVGCLSAASSPSSPAPSSGGSADTTLPTVSISSPSGGATVSGTVTVSANASDDVGVAGVQFRLNGSNLGSEDTSAPYSVSWNTTNVANGSHTLTAVARDAAGNTRTSSGVTVTVSNSTSSAPSTSGWPNNPAGFTTLNDQPWNQVSGNGWNYLRRGASKSSDIMSDGGAPFSLQNVLRMIFTPDMPRDSEPGVHWMGLKQPRELFTGWWMKLSSNWKASPAGGGKITFAWAPDGQGQVYSNIGGSSAPHRININTEWKPYGQKFWEPNVTTTPINYGEWYRIEWYLKYESSPGAGDGIIRWWVNGQLNGDYRNVSFPACCFQQFEFAPTLQNPPPNEQYMYIDHTFVSTP